MMYKKSYDIINKSKFKSFLEPVKVRTVTADEFIRISETQSELIEKVEFKAPSVGGSSFGKFKVTYKNPIFCD